ncbi:MAG: pilin [Patescibacteria group bacterium]|nr:pilin [Patescibacteria group bacterium]
MRILQIKNKKIIFIIFAAIFLISIHGFAKAECTPEATQNGSCFERVIGVKDTSIAGGTTAGKLISHCDCKPEGEGKNCDCTCQGSNKANNCHVGGLINQPICACCGDCTTNDFLGLGLNIANIILKYLGVIALVLFIFGGIMWMTSAGSEEKVKKGKAIIMGAVVGMAIVLSAYVIVQMLMQSLHVEGYLSQKKCTISQPDDGLCVEIGSRYNTYKDGDVTGFECTKGKCPGATTICCKQKEN